MTNLKTNVIQHPTDLILAIMPDDSLPSMIVVKQTEHRIEDWIFQFAIIGASHHIRVSYRDTSILNEILACVDVAESACQHFQSFAVDTTHRYQSDQYQVQVEFGEQPSWEIPTEFEDSLEFTFPQTFTQHPLTRIQWQQRGNTIHWWTLHTYAEAQRMINVHTTSVFHCDKKGE
jgi:hypothetical protein